MAEPVERLLRLLTLLQQRPLWTGPDLAAELGVTTRSLRRDVARLRRLGYRVEAGPGPTGGYRLAAGGELPPLRFDDDEVVALWAALATTTGGAVAGSAEAALSALAKLDRLLPGHLRPRLRALRAVTVPLGAPSVDPVLAELLVTVAGACVGGIRLRIDYVDRAGTPSRRRFDPYRLVPTGRRWYLVGHDPDRDGWRTLRLDRVRAVEVTGHRVELHDPPDAAELVSRSTTVAPYRHTVTAVIDAPLDEVRRLVPSTVAVTEAGEGGRTTLRAGADDPLVVVARLWATGLPFEVVDPPGLRSRVAELARTLLDRHGPVTPGPEAGVEPPAAPHRSDDDP